jgi:hypothetical protein
MGPSESERRRRCERRPAATLRQELVLRMAAMARHPQLVDYDVAAAVVHPGDREMQARCEVLTDGRADEFDAASARLAAVRGNDVVATARLTLWSPVVGFMVEHELLDVDIPLVLGPRAAELSAVMVAEPRIRERLFLALAMLAARVAAAHAIEHLYVVSTADDVRALDGFDATPLGPGAALVDLETQAWEPRRVS